jgi:hypothetical protein
VFPGLPPPQQQHTMLALPLPGGPPPYLTLPTPHSMSIPPREKWQKPKKQYQAWDKQGYKKGWTIEQAQRFLIGAPQLPGESPHLPWFYRDPVQRKEPPPSAWPSPYPPQYAQPAYPPPQFPPGAYPPGPSQLFPPGAYLPAAYPQGPPPWPVPQPYGHPSLPPSSKHSQSNPHKSHSKSPGPKRR